MNLYIDFETYSEAPLKQCGAYNYARHPSTRVLCMAYAWGDEPVRLATDLGTITALVNAVNIDGGRITAHNATFERLIIEHVLQIAVDPERFYCTMAQSQANNLPAGLDKVCRALGMKAKTAGWDLIQACCTPPGNTDRLPELFDYCANDLVITRDLHKWLQPLTQEELEDYWVSERINDRGIPIDVPWVKVAAEATTRLKGEAKAEIMDKTGCTMGPSLTQWLWDRVGADGQEMMAKDNKSGMTRDEAARSALLELGLAPEVREVVELLDAFGGSSALKYKKMLDARLGARVPGCFVYSGAGQTGRFSGRVVQPHNFPRKSAEAPIVRPRHPSVSEAMAHLRPTVYSPRGLTWGDWSNIESVVCPWLTGRPIGLLEAFENGADLYQEIAEGMHVERQVAKAATLALQFGGGMGAFQNTARIYGVSLDMAAASNVIETWHRLNPWARKYGRSLYRAFVAAMKRGGEYPAGRVVYVGRGDLVECRLPSGRTLKYYSPGFDEEGQLTALKTYQSKVIRSKLWHGRLIENATQAVAGDVLRDCLLRLHDERVPVVMHVHDEVVAEGSWVPELEREMVVRPAWGADLPLRCEVKQGEHYNK